mmetsp:Transcript_17819/g.41111  ORF Transcript_17819/g.41111 Transcript_17819/m.41111 type:complete len:244 (+) Transcript_17819:112-843(+)|eukprot:CAMPEP_0197196786 /NCGR_PEP_ID=MMETSP1423-20130617/32533_1 /TAXON_ID=476441 /ORGANISM="Pseudo-nitzschia heimii, Strain UNC1101" /LENGTH=243 /DNA_ID=CAMNT_0042650599 /DNA_START=63 /DNA_END=794 /DNA_ORIENTATION=-
MPRGKNYVNNNRGVFLQASGKKKHQKSMRQCEYGSACNRPYCIYRHDADAGTVRSDEVCLPFLAGMCAFATGGGCRKRHPSKDEKDRLLRKYKTTRCRFGDDCRTEGCLYLHPSEVTPVEPAYVEPSRMNEAFPALSGAASRPLPPSPWNNAGAPTAAAVPPTTWFPPGDASLSPFCTPADPPLRAGAYGGYYGYEQQRYSGGYDTETHQQQQGGEAPAAAVAPPASSFNAGAKEFVPGRFSS